MCLPYVRYTCSLFDGFLKQDSSILGTNQANVMNSFRYNLSLSVLISVAHRFEYRASHRLLLVPPVAVVGVACHRPGVRIPDPAERCTGAALRPQQMETAEGVQRSPVRPEQPRWSAEGVH